MARQAIGIGSAANDGTGDADRTAWGKVNAMTSELYGAAIPFSYVSGRYYHPFSLHGATVIASVALAVNTARFLPVFLPVAVSVDQLFARVSTTGTNMQLAYYNDNGGRPGTEICHSASIATTATGAIAGALSTGSTATIPAGLVWMGCNVDNAATVLQTIGNGTVYTGVMVGSTTIGNLATNGTSANFCLTTPLTFGTWGDLTSATWTELPGSAGHAWVGFRIA